MIHCGRESIMSLSLLLWRSIVVGVVVSPKVVIVIVEVQWSPVDAIIRCRLCDFERFRVAIVVDDRSHRRCYRRLSGVIRCWYYRHRVYRLSCINDLGIRSEDRGRCVLRGLVRCVGGVGWWFGCAVIIFVRVISVGGCAGAVMSK